MTNKISHITILAILTLFGAVLGIYGLSYAAEEPTDAFRSTAFPLPRFVSLSSDEVFVRSGPSPRYPVKWVYRKKGLPVEVILEFEVWRKIKDPDGETGWVHQSLISGKRTGMITGAEKVALLQKPKDSAYKQAMLEPRVVVSLDECPDEWCKVSASGYSGWVEKSHIWGVYEKEKLN